MLAPPPPTWGGFVAASGVSKEADRINLLVLHEMGQQFNLAAPPFPPLYANYKRIAKEACCRRKTEGNGGCALSEPEP